MYRMRILFSEDESTIREFVTRGLEERPVMPWMPSRTVTRRSNESDLRRVKRTHGLRITSSQIAGTMACFHLIWATIAVWAVWQSGLLHNKGFDHFPYAFLFCMLGGIMQSLFVPTMLTASNRAAERDRIKDEADHRSLTHLYEVNEEQFRLLRALVQGQDRIAEAVH